MPDCEVCPNAAHFSPLAGPTSPLKRGWLIWRLGASALSIFAAVPTRPIGKEDAMEKYVHRKNLERFYDLLLRATDDAQREQIKKLIKEEQAKELPPKSA